MIDIPIYSYTCKSCKKTFEVAAPMKDCRKKKKCPDCGGMAYHNIVADHCGGSADSQMRDYQFYGETGTRMYAAAYLPNQINEARKKHPDTSFKFHNGCWIPVIKNRRHKLKFLKERNYVELD